MGEVKAAGALAGGEGDVEVSGAGVVCLLGAQTEPAHGHLTLRNTTRHHITWKAKASFKTLYKVEPGLGLLAPGATGTVKLSRSAFPDETGWAKHVKTRMGRDKLLLMHTRLPVPPDPALPLRNQLVLWWGNVADALVYRRLIIHHKLPPPSPGYPPDDKSTPSAASVNDDDDDDPSL